MGAGRAVRVLRGFGHLAQHGGPASCACRRFRVVLTAVASSGGTKGAGGGRPRGWRRTEPSPTARTRGGSTTLEPFNPRSARLYNQTQPDVQDVVNCRSASRYGGGGLYLEDSPLVMTGGRLDNNAASGDGGGALALAAARDSPRLMIFAGGVSLSGNSATGRGGALAVGKAAPGPAAVKCVPACSFVRNTAAGCAVLHSERQDYYNREIDSVAVAGGTSPSVSPPGAATVSAAASTRPAGAVRPTLLAGEPPSIVLGTSSFTGVKDGVCQAQARRHVSLGQPQGCVWSRGAASVRGARAPTAGRARFTASSSLAQRPLPRPISSRPQATLQATGCCCAAARSRPSRRSASSRPPAPRAPGCGRWGRAASSQTFASRRPERAREHAWA